MNEQPLQKLIQVARDARRAQDLAAQAARETAAKVAAGQAASGH